MSSPLARLAASDSIAAMTDREFAEYWAALGKVVRLTCRAAERGGEPPARDPTSTTDATAERAASWDHDKRHPVVAFGFTSQ